MKNTIKKEVNCLIASLDETIDESILNILYDEGIDRESIKGQKLFWDIKEIVYKKLCENNLIKL